MNVDEIKMLHTVSDVLRRYGVKVERGLAKCPFHKEKTPSLVVKDDHCHCYGCGRHDDIFSIVQHFENCDFKAACEILDGNRKPTLTARRKSEAKAKAREQLKTANEEKEILRQIALNKLIRLSDNYKRYAPKLNKEIDISKLTDSEFDELTNIFDNPMLVEVMNEIDYYTYIYDCLP